MSNLNVVRWLALEAGVSAAGLQGGEMDYLIARWRKGSSADSRDLLEAVQLLVGAGYRGWDAKYSIDSAIARGDLALVQYLLQQQPGYQLDGRVVEKAAKAGCEALLEWLVEQRGCIVDPHGVSPYVRAAANGDKATLVALRRLGVPWDVRGVLVPALELGCDLPAFSWLVEQGVSAVGKAESRKELDKAIRWQLHHAHKHGWVDEWRLRVCAVGQQVGVWD